MTENLRRRGQTLIVCRENSVHRDVYGIWTIGGEDFPITEWRKYVELLHGGLIQLCAGDAEMAESGVIELSKALVAELV